MKLWQAVTFDVRDIYSECGVCGFRKWLTRLQFGAPIQPTCPRCKMREIPRKSKKPSGHLVELDDLDDEPEPAPAPAPRAAPRARIKAGDRFGDWTVMEVRKGDRRCICRCSCGAEVPVLRAMLHVGESKRCQSCARGRHKEAMHEHWDSKRAK